MILVVKKTKNRKRSRGTASCARVKEKKEKSIVEAQKTQNEKEFPSPLRAVSPVGATPLTGERARVRVLPRDLLLAETWSRLSA